MTVSPSLRARYEGGLPGFKNVPRRADFRLRSMLPWKAEGPASRLNAAIGSKMRSRSDPRKFLIETGAASQPVQVCPAP
jgi:hypothetical protein